MDLALDLLLLFAIGIQQLFLQKRLDFTASTFGTNNSKLQLVLGHRLACHEALAVLQCSQSFAVSCAGLRSCRTRSRCFAKAPVVEVVALLLVADQMLKVVLSLLVLLLGVLLLRDFELQLLSAILQLGQDLKVRPAAFRRT